MANGNCSDERQPGHDARVGERTDLSTWVIEY
jgi:hypothetical protein